MCTHLKKLMFYRVYIVTRPFIVAHNIFVLSYVNNKFDIEYYLCVIHVVCSACRISLSTALHTNASSFLLLLLVVANGKMYSFDFVLIILIHIYRSRVPIKHSRTRHRFPVLKRKLYSASVELEIHCHKWKLLSHSPMAVKRGLRCNTENGRTSVCV